MSRTELSPGTQLGEFLIEGRLGAGGMAVVYRARQQSLDRAVALKVFDGSLAHPAEIARFHRAAQAVAQLQHPNIAVIHAVGEEDGLCYLAMEHIEGATFQQVVQRLAAAPDGYRLRLPATGSGFVDLQFAVRVHVHPAKSDTPAEGAEPVPAEPLELLSLVLDGVPGRAAATTVADSAASALPTSELAGAIGPGPDLSLTAGILLTQPNYHRLSAAVRN
jgi:hypothetical protein